MKVKILHAPLPHPEFEPFSIVIEIAEPDALRNLTLAAGGMTNGHGLELYDLLHGKCEYFGVKLDLS